MLWQTCLCWGMILEICVESWIVSRYNMVTQETNKNYILFSINTPFSINHLVQSHSHSAKLGRRCMNRTSYNYLSITSWDTLLAFWKFFSAIETTRSFSQNKKQTSINLILDGRGKIYPQPQPILAHLTPLQKNVNFENNNSSYSISLFFYV